MLRQLLDQVGLGIFMDAIDKLPFYFRLPIYAALGLIGALLYVTLKLIIKTAFRMVWGLVKMIGRMIRGLYRMVFRSKAEVRVPVRKAA